MCARANFVSGEPYPIYVSHAEAFDEPVKRVASRLLKSRGLGCGRAPTWPHRSQV